MNENKNPNQPEYTLAARLLYSISYVLSLLPFRILYLFSDCVIYPIIRYVARYRVKLVRRNITDSFPDKDVKWVENTVNGFYHYLCDVFLESLKMMSMSEDKMKRHLRFENVELVQRYIDERRPMSVFIGHLGCWDWVTSLPLWITGDIVTGQIYHMIENPAVNQLFLRLRSRWGGECIPMRVTLRKMLSYKQENRNWIIGFIADQVPLYNDIFHWREFMHHPDTPVLTGAERLARRFGSAGIYLRITRERRGYYVARFVSLCEDCSQHKDWDVTDMFFDALEDNINAAPQIWLWTHNRWKRTRQLYNQEMSRFNQVRQSVTHGSSE